MTKGNNYRLLKLREILFKETDENHELDLQELKQKLSRFLAKKQIDNRTIKGDLKALGQIGFEITENRYRHGKICYSHQDKLFETYQTRLLIDAILSARFMTKTEKNILIKKLKKLTSRHIARTLPEPTVFSQTRNLKFQQIKLNIDHIHQAITKKHVLTYQYGDYNVNKEFVLRYDGEIYHVEPYALIWENDQYYLIAYSQKHGTIRNYRLDRMRNIKVSEEIFVLEDAFDLQTYVDNSFQMFGGEEEDIQLRVENNLINVMLDRFGMGVKIRADGEDDVIITAKAKVSQGLIGWILKFGPQVNVLSPACLRREMAEKIRHMNKLYEE